MKYEQSTVEAARTVHTQRSVLRSPRMRLFSLLCVAGASAGCASADGDVEQMLVDVENERALRISWEEYLGRAMLTEDGGFIAEGDLMFADEDALRAHYDALTSSEEESKLVVIRRASNGFEPTFLQNEQTNLTYCISNAFSTVFSNKSTVVSHMASATKSWEDLARVKFVYVSSQDAACDQNNVNVQFAVMPMEVPGVGGCGVNKKMWASGPGCKTTPGSALIRGVVLLNYDYAYPGVSTLGILRHELGHLLGFRHEFPWDPTPACTGELQTDPLTDLGGRQLTPYDSVSVMQYPWCDGVPGADMLLSQRDGEGVRAIYGIPASWYVPLTFE